MIKNAAVRAEATPTTIAARIGPFLLLFEGLSKLLEETKTEEVSSVLDTMESEDKASSDVTDGTVELTLSDEVAEEVDCTVDSALEDVGLSVRAVTRPQRPQVWVLPEERKKWLCFSPTADGSEVFTFSQIA